LQPEVDAAPIDSLELETMRIFMMRKFLGFGAVKICKKLEITTTK